MAEDDQRVKYSNRCTPQEFPATAAAGTRWYLDSDCGKKLTGGNTVTLGTGGSKMVFGSQTSDGSLVTQATPKFVYMKNNASVGVEFSLDNSTNYTLRLEAGEAIAFECDSSVLTNTSRIKIAADSSTPNVEYYIGF